MPGSSRVKVARRIGLLAVIATVIAALLDGLLIGATVTGVLHQSGALLAGLTVGWFVVAVLGGALYGWSNQARRKSNNSGEQ